jgi:hypothetical protein
LRNAVSSILAFGSAIVTHPSAPLSRSSTPAAAPAESASSRLASARTTNTSTLCTESYGNGASVIWTRSVPVPAAVGLSPHEAASAAAASTVPTRAAGRAMGCGMSGGVRCGEIHLPQVGPGRPSDG